MRFALAVAAAVGALAFAASAIAQPAMETWTDPKGAFSISRPAAWPVEEMTRAGGPREIVAGTADEECWFTLIDRAETASAPPARLISAFSKPIPTDSWLSVARVQRIYDKQTPTLVSSTVDTAKPFPVQTADLTHPEHGPVVAALHTRPGLEVYAFCVGYTAKERGELFRAVSGSFATPKDADLLAQAAAAAAPPAEAAPPPPAEEKGRRNRRN